MNDWKALARDSLSAREWRESVKRFSGDPSLAAQYIPLARTILGGLVNQLALGGISYGHRIVNLPDGTLIRVIRNGEQNILEIAVSGGTSEKTVRTWRLFVETGWAHLADMTCLNRDKDAGLITVTDDMRKYVYNLPTTFVDWLLFTGENESRVYRTGMESVALPKYILEDGSDPNAPTLDVFERAMGNKSFMARKLLVGCDVWDLPKRPSSIGGKLKFLFQSVLGRQAPTEGVIELLGTPPWGNEGEGLLTTKEWRYYRIKISSSGIYAFPAADLSEPLALFLREMIKRETDFNKQLRLETYLLSITAINTSEGVKIGEIPELAGDPIAYGWHFSWKGHEASIVTQKVLDDSSAEASRYLLKITENSDYDPLKEMSADNRPLKATVSEEQRKIHWFPTLDFPIWVPMPEFKGTTGIMALWNPPRDIWNGYELSGFDAPVYCFYDHTVADHHKDSSLVVINISYSGDPSNLTPLNVLLDQLNGEMNVTYSDSGGSFQFDEISGGSQSFNIRSEGHSDDVELNAVVEKKVSGTLDLSKTPNGLVKTYEKNGDIYNNLGQSVATYGVTYTGGDIGSKTTTVTTMLDGKPLLFVPYFSSEAVFMALHQITDEPTEIVDMTKSVIIKTELFFDNFYGSAEISLARLFSAPKNHIYHPWGYFTTPGAGGGVSSDGVTGTIKVTPGGGVTLECSVLHSWGVEYLDITAKTLTDRGQGAWRSFIQPSYEYPYASPPFQFYNGINEAAYLTNDINMLGDPLHAELAWKSTGGLTHDQREGYFLGWA